ncbi:MAG: hypothetical protein HOV82_17110 [Streptomyces sp.]|nr:hypothetical protein [Streptomyces sp.]NUP36189.1 hypothetical protein [Streptomyces sp.]NUS75536.1 hypothetical protein [Streptomyces sp.]
MAATRRRYQPRPQRVTGWYVEDTHTGRVWAGLTRPGALQLADHLNRNA